MFNINSNHENSAGVEKIKLHMRIYGSVLKSSGEIKISSLQQTHDEIKPILHEEAGTENIDISALIYTSLRLPDKMYKVKNVILGQSLEVFKTNGYTNIEKWKNTFTPGRRRKIKYNNKDNIACFITSVSDIDDIISLLITFQEEWNKFHEVLQSNKINSISNSFNPEAWDNLQSLWGKNKQKYLKRIKNYKVDIRVKLLAGSWLDYTKAVQKWWKNISFQLKPDLRLSHKSIYFVSSNTHSLVNITSGYTLKIENKIMYFIKNRYTDLYNLYEKIKSKDDNYPLHDLLYYCSKKYYQQHPLEYEKKQKFENKIGIQFVPALHYLDVNAQIIPVKIYAEGLSDSRLSIDNLKALKKSKSYIFNIDYPLGFTAYHVLSETMENMTEIKGVYIIGKAATLNGNIGDILIPNNVFDEHSQNTYLIKNCFNTKIYHNISRGSILNNQKAVSVLGTFLQNSELIDNYSKGNLTILEMENGPYINAVCESVYPYRFPNNSVIDLSDTPYDLGIINYASDTLYSKAKNLGVRNLSLDGVEPTYVSSLNVIQRIIDNEENSR